ncbi:hypothetical protein [Polyangium spumosum]|uniref:hypothetical protein n=1 Tax=Polyangium spumosum TaxID=889282 RepID=UPI001478C155|nr:hypothetical protein [Polyangium spumosum]
MRSVSATNIFAREAPEGRQYLAYSMTLSASEDLAMILPLPVPQGTRDDAVTFIDLSGYAEFFRDLAKAFPEPMPANAPRSAPAPQARAPLAVVEVGSFEASFVPTIDDFTRLDPRFRLPAEVWSRLPGHDRFGFAVFKLMKGEKRIHPMAFTFPRAAAGSVFFPTVHVHDGQVHAQARFDHALFLQRSPRARAGTPDGWRSSKKARYYVDVERARGLVDGDQPVHRLRLAGRAPNRDIYVDD